MMDFGLGVSVGVALGTGFAVWIIEARMNVQVAERLLRQAKARAKSRDAYKAEMDQ